MSEPAREPNLRLQPVERERADYNGLRRRMVARLLAVIEGGEPAEGAIARLGFDRTAGAMRILQGLLESP